MTLRDSSRRVRVLLVEDSIPDRQRLKTLIAESKSALVVGEVGSVAGALFLIHSDPVDAVVLDLQLWDGDGCAVLSEVKRTKPSCLVIVLTSLSTPEHRVRCLGLGADHFFDKTKDLHRVPEVLADFRLALSGAATPSQDHA